MTPTNEQIAAWLDTAVWFGPQLVCRAADEKLAAAIAEAMNEWQGQ